MEMYLGSTVISFGELVGPILSKPNYDKQVRLGHILIKRKGGNGRTALIDYQSLPERIKTLYIAQHPCELDNAIKEVMKRTIKHDSQAVEFFKTYQINNSGIVDKLQEEYHLNAMVMNEMVTFEKEMAGNLKRMGSNRNHDGVRRTIWSDVHKVCEDLRAEYHHTLPVNESRLREKFNAYKRDGYRALVSGKVGNNNRRKINQEEARLLLKLKRSRVPIYTDMQIYDEFNRQAEKRGFEKLQSSKTVKNYLYDPSVKPLWWSVVYGEQSWKNKFTAQMKTELPSMRDSLWYSDGTKLNLYYKDDKNMIRTIAVYEVMDSYSEVFLGYDIAPTECFDSQYRAFRMAIEFAKHKPYEIVNDNQGGHTSDKAKNFFKSISILSRRTQPYNAQSKTIESVFGRFQSQYLHQMWNFTGQNITATKENSHINREFLEKNVHKLPTLNEVKEMYKEFRDKWNAAIHPKTGISRMEMYEMSVNPETPAITEIDIVQMFWIKSKDPITYTNKGIKIIIDKNTYEYQVYCQDKPGVRDDLFALKNIDRKFYVLYDPYDMTMIELWEAKASGMKFSAEATPILSIHRATQERGTNENFIMRAQIENNARTRMSVHYEMESFDIDEMIHAEFFGLNTPAPKGISDKRLDEYRKEFEHGKMKSPITVPGLSEIAGIASNDGWSEDIEGEEEPATLGSYTKAISNIDECAYLNKCLKQ